MLQAATNSPGDVLDGDRSREVRSDRVQKTPAAAARMVLGAWWQHRAGIMPLTDRNRGEKGDKSS